MGVLLSFPFIWTPSIAPSKNVAECHDHEDCNANTISTVYYSAFSAIYNICSAIISISHIAMIPEITSIENERGGLTAIRSVGTVMSNIFVYSILFIMVTSGKIVVAILRIFLITIMGNQFKDNYVYLNYLYILPIFYFLKMVVTLIK